MDKHKNWKIKKEILIRDISRLIKGNVSFKEGQIIIAEGILEELKK